MQKLLTHRISGQLVPSRYGYFAGYQTCILTMSSCQGGEVPHMSEDCLMINVLRPSNLPPSAKLPVVSFFHR